MKGRRVASAAPTRTKATLRSPIAAPTPGPSDGGLATDYEPGDSTNPETEKTTPRVTASKTPAMTWPPSCPRRTWSAGKRTKRASHGATTIQPSVSSDRALDQPAAVAEPKRISTSTLRSTNPTPTPPAAKPKTGQRANPRLRKASAVQAPARIAGPTPNGTTRAPLPRNDQPSAAGPYRATRKVTTSSRMPARAPITSAQPSRANVFTLRSSSGPDSARLALTVRLRGIRCARLAQA